MSQQPRSERDALLGLESRLRNSQNPGTSGAPANSVISRVRKRNTTLYSDIKAHTLAVAHQSASAHPSTDGNNNNNNKESTDGAKGANSHPLHPPLPDRSDSSSSRESSNANSPTTAIAREARSIAQGSQSSAGSIASNGTMTHNTHSTGVRVSPSASAAALLTQVPNGSDNNNISAGPQPNRGGGNDSATPTQSATRRRLGVQTFDDKLAEIRKIAKNRSPLAGANITPLLPPQDPKFRGKNTLVLDIDETLVHASFTPAKPYDVKLTVQVEREVGYIYVAYRPGLKKFLDFVSELFEIVIFTASQSCYADQLMNELDPTGRLGTFRLFRQHCSEIMRVGRVKDLSLLGRDLDRVAIIDNSPVAYAYHKRNAIPIVSWFEDMSDREFEQMAPMLRQLAKADCVYDILDEYNAALLMQGGTQ